MKNPETTATSSNQSIAVTLSSLILPGLGQFLLKKRSRGVLIFLTAAILAFLINWSFVHQNIGKISAGTLTTSWLWLPLILFWIWNILDARALLTGKTSSLLFGIIFSAIILYVIAWNVTDVKLSRLIDRFSDAQTVATNLLNPDVLTISVNSVDQICSWDCVYKYASDKLTGELLGRRVAEAAKRWQRGGA